MNQNIHAICLCVITLATGARAETPRSVVRFVNKDFLPGHPQSITPENLVWDSPHLARPASFLLSKVLELSLTPSPSPGDDDHEATVTLTNGDVVRGRLGGVTDELITLDTWFAGRMEFKRPMVSGVEIMPKTNYLFQGPSGIDGWRQTVEPPVWTYQRSAFRASNEGGIAHDQLLPEEFSLSFDTAWRGDSIRLRVVLFADAKPAETPAEGYELSFMRGGVHLRNLKTQAFIGSVQSTDLMENEQVSIEIRGSAKTNQIALFINGRILEVWNEPNEGNPTSGRGLHFISGSKLPMKVSHIRVARWDGELEQMPQPRPGFNHGLGRNDGNAAEKEKENEGRMKLANGDTLAGEVTAIKDGIISVKSPLGEISLPVSRLRTLMLKPIETERTKRYRGDVRAWFPDGGSIVFRLDDSTSDTLTGFSQNFETATFRTSAFSRIEFNVYSPEHQELRGVDDW